MSASMKACGHRERFRRDTIIDCRLILAEISKRKAGLDGHHPTNLFAILKSVPKGVWILKNDEMYKNALFAYLSSAEQTIPQ
ncbi:hypothetical protein OUZ56_029881 [Daphnia magna]|uniref:Uncharacterized protein n=1 Tax=Daphnia magna TaxID=35525 RepID=A0ABR0B855_9CRUS|nr:hypothetical protein OUZ56_029881 [Daphnia magna]